MEIYIKTDLSLDALAEALRETLNLPEKNRAPHAQEQRRYGVNFGGEYYSFEALGIWLNLLKNAGEVEIPERSSFPYYLLAESGAESASGNHRLSDAAGVRGHAPHRNGRRLGFPGGLTFSCRA